MTRWRSRLGRALVRSGRRVAGAPTIIEAEEAVVEAHRTLADLQSVR